MMDEELIRAAEDEGLTMDDTTRRALTIIADSARSLANDLDEVLTPTPTRPLIMSGVKLAQPQGGLLTAASYHDAMGVDQTNGMIGAHNLSAHGPSSIAHHTEGGGASIVESRSLAWHSIGDHTDIGLKFDVEFIETGGYPFDFGWQSKFGWGLGGYHSREEWPGGGVCWPPDWLIRPVWNQYERRGELRFGLYIYSSGEGSILPGQVWASPTTGDGFRRLVLFDAGSTPEAGEAYEIGIDVDRVGPDSSLITAYVDGEVAWASPVGVSSPCNWVTMINGYGGSQPEEGPAHPTSYLLSSLQVVEL